MITTRPATYDDLQAMADVINPIIDAGGTTAFEDPMTADDIGHKTLGASDIVSVLVALDAEGVIAGFQYLRRYAPPDGHIAGIASFARQAPKLKGVGRALFAATCAAARASGITVIDATIRADNAPGLGFYAAMGFEDHSVRKGVPLKDGTPVDRITKRYAL